MAKRKRHSIEGDEEKSYGGVFALMVVIILIAGVVYSILFGAGPEPSSGASSLLAQSLVALESVDKESFTFDGSVEILLGGEYAELPLSGEGRIDSVNRRMSMRINFESIIGALEPVGVDNLNLDFYTLNNDVYLGIGGTWAKFTSETGVWGESRFSQKLVAMAKEFNPGIAEREMINGRETLRVEMEPTVEQLVSMAKSLQPGIFETGNPLANVDDLAGGVKSIDMMIWIDADDFLPVKTQMRAVIEAKDVNSAGLGVISSDVTIDAEVNFDYKTPFNIVLPSAAQRAETVEI